jgi:hypothetical protein
MTPPLALTSGGAISKHGRSPHLNRDPIVGFYPRKIKGEGQ